MGVGVGLSRRAPVDAHQHPTLHPEHRSRLLPRVSDALKNRFALTLPCLLLSPPPPRLAPLSLSLSPSQHPPTPSHPPCFAVKAETWLGATAASEPLPGMEKTNKHGSGFETAAASTQHKHVKALHRGAARRD